MISWLKSTNEWIEINLLMVADDESMINIYESMIEIT